MKWKKFTIYTTTEAEDLVSMMLMDNGVEGVEIENNVPLSDADTKGMFIDILPELKPDDGTSKVSFFLHLQDGDDKRAETEKTDKNALNADSRDSEDRSYSIADRIWTEPETKELIKNIKAELKEMRNYAEVGEGRIEEGETEDTDWRDNWKQYFKPMRIGSFLIKPTWERIPDGLEADIRDGRLKLIEIDPGTAFGTGSHETTQLCLRAIEAYIKENDAVLDIGTGSGILGIAAIKKGAARAVATELDEQCKLAITDNLRLNGIAEESFKLYVGNILGDEDIIKKVHAECTAYDIVIANILAPVICMLAGKGAADSFIKSNGIFITSGIISERLCDVVEAFNANDSWNIIDIKEQGEWNMVIAERI